MAVEKVQSKDIKNTSNNLDEINIELSIAEIENQKTPAAVFQKLRPMESGVP